MSRITGSIAAEAYREAQEILRRQETIPPTCRLPFDYQPPADDGRCASSPGRMAGSGPLHSAITSLARGDTTSRRLVEDAIAAAEANRNLNGVAALDADAALAAADTADSLRAEGTSRGALHGVPITVKDVIDVAGLPTRCGSLAYLDHPARDAVAVQRVRDAGAIVIAKATTHEFALGVTSPQSRNPYDVTRIPGGSSGGSAVCVATGVGLASVGTDTRASIRVPAALSGVVGFKPTYGRIPTTGVVSLSWTMDHVAPMAASVCDAALVLDVLLGGGSALATTAPSTEARIGVPSSTFADAQPGVVSVVTAVLDALSSTDLVVEEAKRPTAVDLAVAGAAGLLVSRSEAAAFHRSLGLDRDLYWDEVAEQLALADSVAAVDYLDAQRIRAVLAHDLIGCFDSIDVLAMPTVPVVAPPVADFADYLMLLARNAIAWSFVGFPAISIPCGMADGLPVGLQLVAPPGREDLLVAVGRRVETAAS